MELYIAIFALMLISIFLLTRKDKIKIKLGDSFIPHPGYEIVYSKSGQQGIRCNKCGLTSFNPNDIKYLYCDHCKLFHDQEKLKDEFKQVEK